MSNYGRRGVGLSAFQNRSNLSTSYASHGAALQSLQSNSLETQISVFQSLLHSYAVKHGEEIKNNPSFQAEFARMCNAIGVDPLAGSNLTGKKGRSWWSSIMGEKVTDFEVKVARRVVEECLATRGQNGGLMSVKDCRDRVVEGKGIVGSGMEVSEEDIVKAVEDLKPLGSGFSIVTIGHRQMIRSVPKALNPDQSVVLGVIQDLGFVTASMLEDNLGWEAARAQTVLEDLLIDSLVWLNEKGPGNSRLAENEYWSPAGLEGHDDH